MNTLTSIDKLIPSTKNIIAGAAGAAVVGLVIGGPRWAVFLAAFAASAPLATKMTYHFLQKLDI